MQLTIRMPDEYRGKIEMLVGRDGIEEIRYRPFGLKAVYVRKHG